MKKRRTEREREKEERDREQETMQRDKELDYFREWEKQEDSVCFNQAVSWALLGPIISLFYIVTSLNKSKNILRNKLVGLVV